MEDSTLLKKSLMVGGAVSVLVGVVGCDDPSSVSQQQAQADFIKQETLKETLQQRNTENTELHNMLITMRERDPSVVDLYYSFDDKGEKQLHIIRDEKVSTSVNDSAINPTSNTSEEITELAKIYDQNPSDNKVVDSANDFKNQVSDITTPVNSTPKQTEPTVQKTVIKMSSNDTYSDSIFPLINGLTTAILLNNFMNSGMNYLNNTYHPTVYKNLSLQERKERQSSAFFYYMGRTMSGYRSSVTTRVSNGSLKSPMLSTRTRGFFSSGESVRSGGYSHGG